MYFSSHLLLSTVKWRIKVFCPSSGLPLDGNVEEMKQVFHNARDLSPKPMTILAALFSSPEEVKKMDLRLKVSKEEKTLALFMVTHRKQLRKSDDGPESLKPFTDFIIDVSVRLRCHAVHNTPEDETQLLIFPPELSGLSQLAGLLLRCLSH